MSYCCNIYIQTWVVTLICKVGKMNQQGNWWGQIKVVKFRRPFQVRHWLTVDLILFTWKTQSSWINIFRNIFWFKGFPLKQHDFCNEWRKKVNHFWKSEHCRTTWEASDTWMSTQEASGLLKSLSMGSTL